MQEGKRTGAPTRLSAEQLSQLVTELHKGAEHHGFSGAVWTRPRVNEVVKELFGISYDPSQIGRILKKVGWSRQKPQRKASQQNLQAVAQWREERLPALKKS
ncbi:winged helix-turn-helix domain-containing protein [Spirosoma utsteinense]|uniref:Transposase n=1 Tax=Spirosoma utsteinense TaxID=2585773 RepID=A0ABR6WEK4_9BACT|nr:winged helix-turn-helix domain-containing protein [Spirosoma utsteinense]MBC3788473.1 transposase [Spirosoma utsteinense]MBC3794440.1 transposase [Spirosoma utsteinense]